MGSSDGSFDCLDRLDFEWDSKVGRESGVGIKGEEGEEREREDRGSCKGCTLITSVLFDVDQVKGRREGGV